MKYLILVLVFGCSIVISCDPMRRINMTNSTDQKAEIIWHIKEDSIHSSPLFISNTKEMKFELLPDKPGNRIRLSAGVGNWTPAELKNFVDDLDSVIIRHSGGEIKLTSEDAIADYLMKRRKGLDRGKIELAIQN